MGLEKSCFSLLHLSLQSLGWPRPERQLRTAKLPWGWGSAVPAPPQNQLWVLPPAWFGLSHSYPVGPFLQDTGCSYWSFSLFPCPKQHRDQLHHPTSLFPPCFHPVQG